MTRGKRPLGVTLVGILYFLAGLFYIMIGLVLVTASTTEIADAWGDTDSTVVMVLGAIIALVGFVQLMVGLGCFKGWGWVWTLGVVVISIGIIVQIAQTFLRSEITTDDLVSLVVSVLVSLLILAYLFRQNVKAWFGKAKQTPVQTRNQ